MRFKVNPSAYINRHEFLFLFHRTESYQSDGWHLARGALCVRRTLQEGKSHNLSYFCPTKKSFNDLLNLTFPGSDRRLFL